MSQAAYEPSVPVTHNERLNRYDRVVPILPDSIERKCGLKTDLAGGADVAMQVLPPRFRSLSRLLQQPQELFDREIRLANDRAKGSAIQLLVIGDNQLAERLGAPKDHVASFLSPYYKSSSRQSIDTGSPRDTRQFTHTAINTASKRSSGTASLSSSKAAM